jgi:hypothetical protein
VFFQKKVHSLSVAPEPLAIWNKKLEGLRSLSLEKLKISSEDIYPAAPKHIFGFFCSRRTRIEGLLSCSQVACFLSEVGGRWWLSWLNAAHILSSSTVSSRVVAFLLLLSITSLNLLLLVHLFHVHRSLAYKYPLASCCKSAKSWCRTYSLAAMNMIVYKVEQPTDVSQKSCVACSGWNKSCDRD